MPNFISREGVWEPRTERVYIEEIDQIYEGPDRAAQQMLKENGGEMGMHFSLDGDLLMRVKNFGFNSIDDYLKFRGYDKKKWEEKFNGLKAELIRHKNPTKVQPTQFEGGGIDQTGASHNNRFGGFGEPGEGVPGVKTKEVSVKPSK